MHALTLLPLWYKQTSVPGTSSCCHQAKVPVLVPIHTFGKVPETKWRCCARPRHAPEASTVLHSSSTTSHAGANVSPPSMGMMSRQDGMEATAALFAGHQDPRGGDRGCRFGFIPSMQLQITARWSKYSSGFSRFSRQDNTNLCNQLLHVVLV